MERVITYTVDNPLPRQKVRGFLKLKHYSTHSLKRLRDQRAARREEGMLLIE